MDIKTISFFLMSLCVTITHQKLYSCNSIASCGCSQYSASINARIINGEIASIQTWSWAVSLGVGDYVCGGSIISDSYIITAGHCVKDISKYSITVYVGSTELFKGDAYTVSHIYLHPQYYIASSEGYVLHDIALLKLSTPLSKASQMWTKICLPKHDTVLTNNTDLIAVGWGKTHENNEYASETLRQVTLNAIDASTQWCRTIILNASTQFCAGVMPYGGKDACQGDSGGPLMKFNDQKQWEIQGITSYGDGCARAFKPGVYTRVGYYLDWIKQILDNDFTTTTTATRRTNTLSRTASKKLNLLLIYVIVFIMFS